MAYWLALLLRPFAGDVGAVKGVFALSIMTGGLGVAASTRRSLAGWAGRRDITERAAVSCRRGLHALAAVAGNGLRLRRGTLAEAVLMGLVPWALYCVSGVRCQV